jgi:hypothetical protein
LKKLVASLLLAFTLIAQADTETETFFPFSDGDDVDYSLTQTFSLVRKFPDTSFDGVYMRPTREQLEEIIRFYQLSRDLDRWVEEASDCDDIGREFMHSSHVWLRRTFPELPTSIAVGMVYVEIDGDYGPLAPSAAGKETKGLHVLNVVWLADGSWVFVEPQNGCIASVEGLIYEGVLYVFRVDL